MNNMYQLIDIFHIISGVLCFLVILGFFFIAYRIQTGVAGNYDAYSLYIFGAFCIVNILWAFYGNDYLNYMNY